MQITVKILNGGEVKLEVSEDDQILMVKRLVSDKLDVPVAQQRLVFKGKTLADSSCLRDYHVADGSKLHLFVRKTGEAAKAENTQEFFGQLRNFLRAHFRERDAELVLAKFKEDLKSWVWSMNLDDIERMAALHTRESSPPQ